MQDNPQQPTKQSNKTSAVHTYAGDMAKMVRDNEASVIKIALAEQKRREQEAMKIDTAKKKTLNFWLIVGSIIFIIAAFYAVSAIEQKAKQDAIHKEVLTKFPMLIPDDTQSVIPSDNFSGIGDVAQAILKDQSMIGKIGSVHSIIFTLGTGANRTLLSSTDFLKVIQSSMPDKFKSTLDPAMMIGTYTNADANPQPHTFIILKTNNYDSAYSGSLDWEKTLLNEFFPIFKIDVSGANAGLLQKPFSDLILQNRNVRVLTSDTTGNPLLYSLWLDRRFYMLTDSPDAINEITSRVHTMDTTPQ